jgi:hypothetical protein
MRKSGEIRDSVTVFIAVLSWIAGVNGIYKNAGGQNSSGAVVWIALLFAFNYWLCFYHLKKK